MLLLCLLISISCVSHMGSPSQTSTFPPARGSLSLPTSRGPLRHPFLLSCVPSTTAASLWGLGFLSRPPAGRGQGAEPRSGRATGPWGKGCGRAQPHLPPGHPSCNQSALHKDGKSRRTHRFHEKREMNLDALFQHIQLTEKQAREKRHLIQQGLPWGCHFVGRQQHWPHLMASPFPGGRAGWPHCAATRGPLSVKPWQAAGLAASCQWHVFIRT